MIDVGFRALRISFWLVCFGFDADKFGLSFDVACHLGTLIAVLIYFRSDVLTMIAALPRLFRPSKDDAVRPMWLLVVATIPAAIVGLLFNKLIEEDLRTPQFAAAMLAIGGIGFFVADRVGSNSRSDRSLTLVEAFWIGCAQASALVPGVSRSGITITLALLLGLRRAEAARFIFLLSIPATFGAAVSEASKMLKAGATPGMANLFVIGIATSIVGFVTVKYFIKYLAGHRLDVFGWYRLALSAVVVVWLLR